MTLLATGSLFAADQTRVVEGDQISAREVAFSALITNPMRYDGKRISVVGFYHDEFECSVLVPEKFDWNTRESGRDFRVDDSSNFAEGARANWKNDTWVRIEAIFDARHFNLSPGSILRVTKFEPLEGPPKAPPALGEDDPHDLEKLGAEIVIKPFPMDGRPIAEAVAALNRQITSQLTERGFAGDWLRINLDPESNPRARVRGQPESPLPLRRLIGWLAFRVSPGEKFYLGADRSTYTYVLPNLIRLRVTTSVYPDDKEPISFHEGSFGDHAVRAKLVRYAGQWKDPDYFEVSWRLAADPEAMRSSDALALARKILPDEPGGKLIKSLAVRNEEGNWEWTVETEAEPETAVRLHKTARVDGSSPVSHFAGQEYHAPFNAKIVRASPPWDFTGPPPLELSAAIKAARLALKEVPNAVKTLKLTDVWLGGLDWYPGLYEVTFRDPTDPSGNYLTIPVYFSGRALALKKETR